MSATSASATSNVTAENWAAIGRYLNQQQVQLLSPEGLAELGEQWREITHQEENLDDAILIGLVGGTGVGKSTFINALAGQRVSRSSDRRPTTDRVVVYRHVNTEISGDVPTSDFAQPEVLHDNDAIEKVILFDFPDFDSAEETHAHIIRRYLAHLDVLLVVVDDVKYADRRLYELLSTLDHDPKNIFVMMNKIDRLADRYGGQSEQVIAELLEDFSQKLIANSGLELADDQKFPIAALAVLEAREQDAKSATFERFAAVESMLATYKEEKHRRAAKELNIEARKRDLVESLAGSALGSENQSILTEARQLVQGWRGALDEALQSVPVEILGESERRGLYGARLRQVGPSWGLPFSLFFTLLGEIRKRSSKAVAVSDLGQRVMHHYRGFFEAVKNVRARFESEFQGSKIRIARMKRTTTTTSIARTPAETAKELQAVVQQERPQISYAQRCLAHIPGLGTLALTFWGQIYDILDGETGIFAALFETLSPTFIIGTILGVLLVYAGTTFVIWLREVQKLEHQIGQAEEATRDLVRKTGQDAVDQLDANVNSLYEEFEQLRALVG